LWLKLAVVSGLTVFHLFLGACRRSFVAGQNRRSGRFFRVINELPTLILIIVVILVVAKPFS
jgi:protoporphyrinogen IX oxidase